MAKTEGTRRYERVSLAFDAPLARLLVDVYVDGRLHGEGRVMDLSEEGAFLRTDEDLTRFRPVYLYMVVGAERVCEARGTVVWLSDEGVGINFPQPNSAFRHLVRELVELDASGRCELIGTLGKREIHFD